MGHVHLHFDCFSGISGDMVLGALVDAGAPFQELRRGLKDLRVDGFTVTRASVTRGAIHATKVNILIKQGLEAPLSLPRIHAILSRSRLPSPVKERSRKVFEELAKAESRAHGVTLSKVHFHEVGVVDSFVDVVGGVLGCHLLGVTRITSSAVNLGAGLIDSSHGQLPVPGPAVAALARDLPVYSAGPQRELTTPTGMALLRVLVDEFGPLPIMRPERIGYGAGNADPKNWPNVLRVFLSRSSGMPHLSDRVLQIETNLDDLNPQAYETVFDRLLEAGALDVTLTPVIMKRGRPGIVLTVLAQPEKADGVIDLVLRDTTALGVRVQEMSRCILPRRFVTVRVRGGAIRMKLGEMSAGAIKAAPEYRDCKRVAEQTGRPVKDIMEEAALAYREAQGKSKKAKVKRGRA